jgi:hypothetical protein
MGPVQSCDLCVNNDKQITTNCAIFNPQNNNSLPINIPIFQRYTVCIVFMISYSRYQGALYAAERLYKRNFVFLLADFPKFSLLYGSFYYTVWIIHRAPSNSCVWSMHIWMYVLCMTECKHTCIVDIYVQVNHFKVTLYSTSIKRQ